MNQDQSYVERIDAQKAICAVQIALVSWLLGFDPGIWVDHHLTSEVVRARHVHWAETELAKLSSSSMRGYLANLSPQY